MTELVVLSGKGGTGKTSITAALAYYAQDAVLADCDVDAANLHVVLQPSVQRREAFFGGSRARIDPERCRTCGACRDVCRFDAVQEGRAFAIDPLRCEGCGVCERFCPQGAVIFEPVQNGEWFVSHTRLGTLVHARLGVAEENSGKLVTVIRREAKALAQAEGKTLVLIDGSPGIGCPVIASLTGTDKALLVAEPTVSGLHDLERVFRLARRFEVQLLVCVNKWDLNRDMTETIRKFCEASGGVWAGCIRYDDEVFRAQAALKSVPEATNRGVTQDLRALWEKIKES